MTSQLNAPRLRKLDYKKFSEEHMFEVQNFKMKIGCGKVPKLLTPQIDTLNGISILCSMFGLDTLP